MAAAVEVQAEAAPPASPEAVESTTGAPQQAQRGRGGGARGRTKSLEMYTRVERPRGETPEDEVRITSAGPVQKYVSYAEKVLESGDCVTLRATGMAIAVAVAVAEVVKRKVKDLHQSNSIAWTELVDEYTAPGLPSRTQTRTVPSLAIILTTDEEKVKSNAVGYQAPLQFTDEAAATAEAEAIIASSGRGGKSSANRRNNSKKQAQQQQQQPVASTPADQQKQVETTDPNTPQNQQPAPKRPPWKRQSRTRKAGAPRAAAGMNPAGAPPAGDVIPPAPTDAAAAAGTSAPATTTAPVQVAAN